jgi:hypothetical protein
MAVAFPAIRAATGRTMQPGAYPVRRSTAPTASVTSTVRGDRVTEVKLVLDYGYIEDEQAALIWATWHATMGGFREVTLPGNAFHGVDPSVVAKIPPYLGWYMEGAPEATSVQPGWSRMQVAFIGRLAIGGAQAAAAPFSEWVGEPKDLGGVKSVRVRLFTRDVITPCEGAVTVSEQDDWVPLGNLKAFSIEALSFESERSCSPGSPSGPLGVSGFLLKTIDSSNVEATGIFRQLGVQATTEFPSMQKRSIISEVREIQINGVLQASPLLPVSGPNHALAISAAYSQSSVHASNIAATQAGMQNGVYAETLMTATSGSALQGWIEMDFGSTRSFSSVVIGCDFTNTLAGGWGPTYSGCAILGRNDSTAWTSIAATGSFDAAYTVVATPGSSYRYIRLSRLPNGLLSDSLVATELYAMP